MPLLNLHGCARRKRPGPKSPKKGDASKVFTPRIRIHPVPQRAVAITIPAPATRLRPLLLTRPHSNPLHEEGSDGSEGSQAERGLETGRSAGDGGRRRWVGGSWAAWVGSASGSNGGTNSVGGVDDSWDA